MPATTKLGPPRLERRRAPEIGRQARLSATWTKLASESRASPLGYMELCRHAATSMMRLPLRNATSHADRHGHGCPPALAMHEHSGGADLAGARHR